MRLAQYSEDGSYAFKRNFAELALDAWQDVNFLQKEDFSRGVRNLTELSDFLLNNLPEQRTYTNFGSVWMGLRMARDTNYNSPATARIKTVDEMTDEVRNFGNELAYLNRVNFEEMKDTLLWLSRYVGAEAEKCRLR